MSRNDRRAHFERARDELYSHVVRCEVLQANPEDREAWMDDTIEYMAERYPRLSALELAQLDAIGRRFIQPAIPHGSKATAVNRDEWQADEHPEAELVGTS